jgi:hypothetical protein
MSQLLAHRSNSDVLFDIPKTTKEGFLFNETGPDLNAKKSIKY